MKKFLTFDEKILTSMTIKEYINYLCENLVVGLEVAVHENLLDFDDYKKLIKEASKNSIDINFHVPDFVVLGEFEISNINNDYDIKKNFTHFYDNILRLLESTKKTYNPIITFHGAKVHYNNYLKASDKTMFFSDWSLNLFENRNLPFKLSIESLNAATSTYGDSRIDLLKIVSQFESEKLGICWDIVHDYNNLRSNYKMPEEVFLRKVNNVHIHGAKVSSQNIEDHIPLYKSEIDTLLFIDFLKNNNYKSYITHELLSFRCSNYKYDLDKDLDFLKTLF